MLHRTLTPEQLFFRMLKDVDRLSWTTFIQQGFIFIRWIVFLHFRRCCSECWRITVVWSMNHFNCAWIKHSSSHLYFTYWYKRLSSIINIIDRLLALEIISWLLRFVLLWRVKHPVSVHGGGLTAAAVWFRQERGKNKHLPLINITARCEQQRLCVAFGYGRSLSSMNKPYQLFIQDFVFKACAKNPHRS